MSEQNQEYLLAISLGPVQGFIAAARKTRDLWFGSKLLSDIAKKTAKFIKENNDDLIFPGVENDADIDINSDTSIANVILAVVKGDPQQIAKQAKEEANKAWRIFADKAKKEVEAKGTKVIRDDVWEQQVDDFVEFYAAWVPYNGSDYPKKRNRVMRLLAGRKNCRDFIQEKSNPGLPKSSLDGSRDTVLQENLPEVFREDLHIREGEQLDVIGVVKRFTETKPFKSTFRIAVDPLVRDNPGLAAEFERIDEIDDNKRLQKEAEKSPYLAILCADGDKMGAAISKQKTPENHKKLSIALSKFANDVPGIVKQHYGECVYAGGDDVLAFLPLDTVLECARELHDDFADKLDAYEDQNVSLSVGIVVGHYHEMLETLLNFARKAESTAKKTNEGKTKSDPRYGDRNGLAVWTYHRGNSLCGVRERWKQSNGVEKSLDERIIHWAKLFEQGDISAKFPYDLRTIANLYMDSNVPEEGIRADAVRSTKQKQIKPELFDNFNMIHSAKELKSLADELLIAQMIGSATKLAKRGEKHEH